MLGIMLFKFMRKEIQRTIFLPQGYNEACQVAFMEAVYPDKNNDYDMWINYPYTTLTVNKLNKET